MDAEKQRGLEDQPTKRGCELHLKFKNQENKTLPIKEGLSCLCVHTHTRIHENISSKC